MKLRFPTPNSSDAEILDDDGNVMSNVSEVTLHALAKGQVHLSMTVIPKDLEVVMRIGSDVVITCERCGCGHNCKPL